MTPETKERVKTIARRTAIIGGIGLGVYVAGPPAIRGARYTYNQAIRPATTYINDQWSVALHGPRPIVINSISDVNRIIEDERGDVDETIKILDRSTTKIDNSSGLQIDTGDGACAVAWTSWQEDDPTFGGAVKPLATDGGKYGVWKIESNQMIKSESPGAYVRASCE